MEPRLTQGKMTIASTLSRSTFLPHVTSLQIQSDIPQFQIGIYLTELAFSNSISTTDSLALLAESEKPCQLGKVFTKRYISGFTLTNFTRLSGNCSDN